MKLDLSPGTSIDEAITAMLKVAPVCREKVTVTFNGIELSANHNTTRADLEGQWQAGTEEASKRYWLSPEAVGHVAARVGADMDRLAPHQRAEVVRRIRQRFDL